MCLLLRTISSFLKPTIVNMEKEIVRYAPSCGETPLILRHTERHSVTDDERGKLLTVDLSLYTYILMDSVGRPVGKYNVSIRCTK